MKLVCLTKKVYVFKLVRDKGRGILLLYNIYTRSESHQNKKTGTVELKV